MRYAIARPNPKKVNPSLAHLRRVVVDFLDVPEPEPNRYEQELDDFKRKHYAVRLSGGIHWYNSETGQEITKGDK